MINHDSFCYGKNVRCINSKKIRYFDLKKHDSEGFLYVYKSQLLGGVFLSKIDAPVVTARACEEIFKNHGLNSNYLYLELGYDYLYCLLMTDSLTIIHEDFYPLNKGNDKEILTELRLIIKQSRASIKNLLLCDSFPHQKSTHEQKKKNEFISEFEIIINGRSGQLLDHDDTLELPNVIECNLCVIDSLHHDNDDEIESKNKTAKAILKKTRLVTFFSVMLPMALLATAFFILSSTSDEDKKPVSVLPVFASDPHAEYKKTISDNQRVTHIESALTQIGYAIGSFDYANKSSEPLNWVITSIKSSDSYNKAIIMQPVSIGGNRGALARLAQTYSIPLMYTDSGLNLAIGLNDSSLSDANGIFYHASLDAEVDYINESIQFLQDDVSIILKNRAVSGSGDSRYTTGLVEIKFECWLPRDFIFVATQFARRQYSFHSINATANKYDEIANPCGFSGMFNIEVFSKG